MVVARINDDYVIMRREEGTSLKRFMDQTPIMRVTVAGKNFPPETLEINLSEWSEEEELKRAKALITEMTGVEFSPENMTHMQLEE